MAPRLPAELWIQSSMICRMLCFRCLTMKESVAAEAPVVPPETGASMKAGERLLQPGNGCAPLCSLASDTAAAISLEVLGLMVEQSMRSDALVPPAYLKSLHTRCTDR